MRHFGVFPFRGPPSAPASSYQSRARSTMSAWRLADPAAFPDVVLESILEYGLCVPNLVDVSSVCRRWMQATQEPTSWGRKKVFIEESRGFTFPSRSLSKFPGKTSEDFRRRLETFGEFHAEGASSSSCSFQKRCSKPFQLSSLLVPFCKGSAQSSAVAQYRTMAVSPYDTARGCALDILCHGIYHDTGCIRTLCVSR